MTSLIDYQKEDQWRYDRPSLAVDGVILRYHEEKVQVLLLKRSARFRDDDSAGKFALVGGFQPNGLTLEENLIDKIAEKTGLQVDDRHIEQLVTFSEPDRDERLWVISVAYLVYMPFGSEIGLRENAVDETYWVDVALQTDGHLSLETADGALVAADFAFDHYQILRAAMARVAGRLSYLPTVLAILPTLNTMTTYRKFYGQFMPCYLDMNSTDFLRKHKQFFTKTNQKVKTTKRQAALFSWQISYEN